MSERWAPIPGFAGYEASTHGRVRSLDRRLPWTTRAGRKTTRMCQGRLMSISTSARTGYLKTEIGGKTVQVHQVVTAAFLGPCPEGHEVAHGDGVRANCWLENLRYATPAQNAADRLRHGTHGRGERGSSAKLTWSEVATIRALKGTYTQAILGARFGVSAKAIGYIHRGETWASPTGLVIENDRRAV